MHSIGHRNPQGLSWQPGSGRLFAAEHGPSGWDGPGGDDEVNVVREGLHPLSSLSLYHWLVRPGGR